MAQPVRGHVVLEALASGLPVVDADTWASRDALGGCPAARLFAPAQASRTIPRLVAELTDPRVRGSFSTQARTAVEALGWAGATAELLNAYRRAIDAA